jgi:hypothetical protein
VDFPGAGFPGAGFAGVERFASAGAFAGFLGAGAACLAGALAFGLALGFLPDAAFFFLWTLLLLADIRGLWEREFLSLKGGSWPAFGRDLLVDLLGGADDGVFRTAGVRRPSLWTRGSGVLQEGRQCITNATPAWPQRDGRLEVVRADGSVAEVSGLPR